MTVALVLLVAVAGCSTTGSGNDARAGDTSADATSGSGEPIDLADLVTTRDELHPGETMTAPPVARKLGVGSLGYCGLPFPSEDLRTARHQVTIRDEDKRWAGVTEAIRYQPGGAAQAVNDLRSAFIECPEDEFITPPSRDGTTNPDAVPHRYDAFPLMEDDLPGVARDHVAARATFTERDGSSTRSFIVLQRRGDVAIVCIAPTEQRALELANAAGRRLAAAPAGSLGD